ncbi:hypothetical protein BJF79_32050 [Actinomadura sp. CNU-125]|uniref:site-specific integrase n=1 Tax=Actinomadura sp. CNU-125 TaxID=1904961 RepID=UPI00096593FB|nr:site-specific integrase [Actinomadura sp. CNU-125]OLT35747.1 hypothetical protein BJF79_32050 [Actinomadura sp. CNU-125]
MSVVAFPGRSGTAAGGCTVAAAVGRYLDSIPAATTRASYDDTLARLIDVAGGAAPVADLAPEDYAAVMDRWNGAAAATWNRHLSALTSFTAWAQRQELLETNPARRLERRKSARRGDRASRAPGWTSCSATTRTGCASGCCGGCCTRPPPAPRRSSR